MCTAALLVFWWWRREVHPQCTWRQGGIRKNILSYIITECVRGAGINHGKSTPFILFKSSALPPWCADSHAMDDRQTCLHKRHKESETWLVMFMCFFSSHNKIRIRKLSEGVKYTPLTLCTNSSPCHQIKTQLNRNLKKADSQVKWLIEGWSRSWFHRGSKRQ